MQGRPCNVGPSLRAGASLHPGRGARVQEGPWGAVGGMSYDCSVGGMSYDSSAGGMSYDSSATFKGLNLSGYVAQKSYDLSRTRQGVWKP
jgi:hypothetical protein